MYPVALMTAVSHLSSDFSPSTVNLEEITITSSSGLREEYAMIELNPHLAGLIKGCLARARVRASGGHWKKNMFKPHKNAWSEQ